MGEMISKFFRKEQTEYEMIYDLEQVLIQPRNSKPVGVNLATTSQMEECAAKIPLQFLLLGKTGHGKSETGNSILGRMKFNTSPDIKSETKEVKVAFTKHDLYDIRVVDGPGLEDTNLNKTQNKKAACANMAKALLMCNGGVHAFLLVIRFGTRFTAEERKAVSDLKTMFGRNFLKDHGIIVVTFGDQFQLQMKRKGTPDKIFTEWLEEQDDDLFEECSPRIVLFNNVTESEEEKECQRNELFHHAEKLSQENGIYTNEHFKRFADLREEMERTVPVLKESVQKKISLLKTELGQLSEKPTLQDVEHLETLVDDVLKEVDQGQNEESLKDLTENVRKIKNFTQELGKAVKEGNSDMIKSHVDSLKKLKKGLKEAIQIPWEVVLAVIGLTIATGGTVAACVGAAGLLAPSLVRGLSTVGRVLIPMGAQLFGFAIPNIGKKLKEQYKKIMQNRKTE